MIDSIFLPPADDSGLRQLLVENAVLTERDRLWQIINDPATHKYRSIAMLLAFETSLSASVCRDILSKLK